MRVWIPVIGTLAGTLVGAFITWRIERYRHRLNAETDLKSNKAKAYSAFLTAVYQFVTTSDRVDEIGKLSSWLTAPRNLRFLERSGLASASTNAQHAFMEGYTLVLIWGSDAAKKAAESLLATVRSYLESESPSELAPELAEKRSGFLLAVHQDLGLPYEVSD